MQSEQTKSYTQYICATIDKINNSVSRRHISEVTTRVNIPYLACLLPLFLHRVFSTNWKVQEFKLTEFIKQIPSFSFFLWLQQNFDTYMNQNFVWLNRCSNDPWLKWPPNWSNQMANLERCSIVRLGNESAGV